MLLKCLLDLLALIETHDTYKRHVSVRSVISGKED
jgi:hypothetical protein